LLHLLYFAICLAAISIITNDQTKTTLCADCALPHRHSLQVRGSCQYVLTTFIAARSYTLLLINARAGGLLPCDGPPARRSWRLPLNRPRACVSCIYDVGLRTCWPLPSLPPPHVSLLQSTRMRSAAVRACVRYEAKFQFGL